jgi:site-specific DNA recombinase
MRTYFAYIRVSTIKQGEKGSSLQEQKDAILAYAKKHNLQIVEFFEEQQTAAKLGRATFRKMMGQLKKGKAHGLIMHKVDRGARNLADWAEIAALKDIGIDVHFAHEAIDLNSRGGRLSADIQAVVASDFIRNLRDEVKKGIYGRLKQGYYPFKAPPGYRDNGKGQLKTIDEMQGPLMREAFELYAAGSFGLHNLRAHMTARGLRNTTGRPFNVSGLAVTLANPFYYGLMVVQGQSFVGKHAPLISKSLFDDCRARAAGRLVSKTRMWGKSEHNFRGLITCAACKRRLYAETQKGHVYYRCQTKSCKGTCLSEALVQAEIDHPLSYLPTPPVLMKSLKEMFRIHAKTQTERAIESARILSFRLSQIDARTEALTDIFIEGAIDRQSYDTRKKALQNEHFDVRAELENVQDAELSDDRLEYFLELAKSLSNMADLRNEHEFREYAKSAISNLSVCQKTVEIKWSGAVATLLDIGGFHVGALRREDPRTCRHNVTDRDVCSDSCSKCAAERDETFIAKMHEHGESLYQAIISDDRLDQLRSKSSKNYEVGFL